MDDPLGWKLWWKYLLFCVKQRSCKHCFKNEWTLVNNFNDILQNYHRNSTVSGHVSVTSDSDPFDYDMSNRAQLPKGIEKIRPHLERYHSYTLDTIQDFLCKLGVKPHVHLLEISIFSLNHVIVRPTKTPKLADKKYA